jgi:uncharacterized protein YihD (DUF1040 family)
MKKDKDSEKNKTLILHQLEKLWKKNPDLRFFQIIEIIKKHSENKTCPPFYQNDEEILDNLKRVLKDNNQDLKPCPELKIGIERD